MGRYSVVVKPDYAVHRLVGVGSRCRSTVAQWHVSGVYYHTVANLEVVWLPLLVRFCSLAGLGNRKLIPELGEDVGHGRRETHCLRPSWPCRCAAV